MTKSRHVHITPTESCEHVYDDDGIDPRKYFANDYQRKTSRKTLQLCSQVGEVINTILVGECIDDVLSSLIVMSVVPAPNTDRLMVTLGLTQARDFVRPEQIMEHLHKMKGKLRGDIASSINRKRAPDLAFRIVLWSENHEQG